MKTTFYVHTCATVLIFASLSAWGSQGGLTVSESPSSFTAGSQGNAVVFTFVASSPSQGTAVITVPGVASGVSWSAPQTANRSLPGYVTISGGPSGSCSDAKVASITGSSPGPWNIAIKYQCAHGKSFSVAYAGTAATKAGGYSFAVGVSSDSGTATNVFPATVVPGPLANISLVLTSTSWVPGVAQTCTVVNPTDAYGNPIPNFDDTMDFSSSDPKATAVSAPFGENASLTLFTAGMQTITVADSANPSVKNSKSITVLGPVANPVNISLVYPPITLFTNYSLDYLSHDTTYTPNTKVVSVGEPILTGGSGVGPQVGLSSISTNGKLVLWNTDPFQSTITTVNGVPVFYCNLGGGGSCGSVTQTIFDCSGTFTMNYTIDDGYGNQSSNMATLVMACPPIPFPSNLATITLYPAVSTTGFSPAVGILIPTNLVTIDAVPVSVDDATLQVTLPLSLPLGCNPNTPPGTACTLNTTATVVLPPGITPTTTVTSLMLNAAPLQVTGPVGLSGTLPQATVTSQSQTGAPTWNVGALYNLGSTPTCSDALGFPVACPTTTLGNIIVPSLVGDTVGAAGNATSSRGLNLSLACATPVPPGNQAGIVTSQSPSAGVLLVAGQSITVNYYAASCPS